MTRSLISTQTCALVPIDLNNSSEFTELQRQRVLCGWHSSDATLLQWREKQAQNLKALFWIIFRPHNTGDSDGEKQQAGIIKEIEPPIRAGHIALDSYCDPPDPALATVDKTIMTIQTFFILPEYRAHGLGGQAMDLIEAMATRLPFGSPQCKFLTLNTISKRYYRETDAPEWGGIWKDLPAYRPPFSAQEWYERRGYVQWKEEPRYPERTKDGKDVLIVASFLRKDVQAYTVQN